MENEYTLRRMTRNAYGSVLSPENYLSAYNMKEGKAEFYATHIENAIKLSQGDAKLLNDRLRSAGYYTYIVIDEEAARRNAHAIQED